MSGNAGDTVSDTVTASATDDDGNPLSETAGASVDITDAPPTMVVSKSADPATIPEPGGPVRFSVSVENTSPEPIALSTLSDDVYGNLDGRGDCSLPQTIAVGATYSCSAVGPVTGDAGDVREDIIEAIASDDDGNTITETADAQVVITDVQPAIAVAKRATPSSLPEPGGPVSFTVQASNPSIEPVILESLVDDIHGDLDGQGTCQLPQTLTAGGGTYTCSFTAVVTGDVGDSETDTVTATGRDNEGNPAAASAQATVTITDVRPGISLQKSAVPNSRPEPGGDYDIRISVVNRSAVESVLLTSLDDDLLGDLDGQGDCAVPQTIAPAGSYQCTIPASLTGDAGDSETDTVTATASDNEGTEVVESDSATFSIVDRLPTFDLQKTASPSSVPEPGGDVTFTIAITNTSPEDLTLTDLFDDNYGDLSGQGTCSVPQTLAPGATYSCAFTEYVANNAGETKIDIVAATVEDNEGNSTTLTDSASVTTTDTPPTFSVDKSLLYPAQLDEPGGTAFYRLVVTNTSLEPITLTALVDDPGSIDLDGRGSCSVPQTIPPGGTYACSFGLPVSGDGGDTVQDTVTVTGEDNDGTSVDVSDSAQIDIADVLPAIDVDKSADPTSVIAPGGDVTFTVVVTNDSVENVTLVSLIDDPYGDITALPGDCAVPQVLAPGDSYTCAFTVFVSGSLGELVRDTVTGSATDNEGNTATDSDGATVGVGGGGVGPGSVTVSKSASPATLPEPGGDFTFSVTVTGEPFFSVLELFDDIYGDLNGQGDCVLPQLAIASGTYTCSFPGVFTGDPGDSQTDVVGVRGTDASGPFVRFDSATVGITDILPALEVTKTATPNPIDEPGGAVTFGVEVTNTSLEESFLTLLTDDVYGDLDGRGDCVADGSVAIAPGATYTCSFTADVTGNAGDVKTDLVLAQLSDDDGNDAFVIGRADVVIDDVLPSITLAKTPRPASVPEPGGIVSFGVVVTNTSIEPVEITSLSDDVYGDLDGQGSCVLPQTIAPGARYICSFPATVSGNAGDTATDVITASGTDDEGNPVVETASASVPITESAPSLSISKVASPASLPEPGGSVSYTVTITNSSVSTDPVTIDSLSDSIEGAPGVVPTDLACVSAGADVSVPFTLASGASAVCTFGGSVSGNAGDSTSDTFTASGTDDEGAPARGSGSETVPITDVLPTMTVLKSSVPNPIPEPGGVVDYTATVTNTSPESITLTALNDDVAGPLSASCGLPVDIASGASFACSWSGSVSGDVGDVRSNVVYATANDDDGNTVQGFDQDDVVIGNLDPVIRARKVAAPTSLPEPGGTVTFTVTVINDSVEPVTLQTIPDDVYGDLDGQGTCQLPQTLTANGGFYTCTFRGAVTGSAADSPYTDTFTPTVIDNEGNVGSAVATADVILTDRVPSITVVKNRRPASLPEPGGVFTFPIVVTNDSTIEAVVLTDLDDDIYGDIADAGNPALVSTSCVVPQTIAPGARYACEFSGEFLGNAGQSQRDIVTATAADDEGNVVTDTDPARVSITDVLPQISATKTPDPASLPEPGGDVTFSVTVSNLSTVEAVSLTDLLDDVYGDITVHQRRHRHHDLRRAADDRHRRHVRLCVHGARHWHRGRLAVRRYHHRDGRR